LYHTSAPGVLEQLLETMGLETVAPAKVPGVLTQPDAGVSNVAPEQLSFVGGDEIGGSVIQIVKSYPLPGAVPVFLFVPTLTKYVAPIVNPEATKGADEPLHPKEAPPQVENIWIPSFTPPGKDPVTVIVGMGDCATKLYHTSAEFASILPHVPLPLGVELFNVPATVTLAQLAPLVIIIAP